MLQELGPKSMKAAADSICGPIHTYISAVWFGNNKWNFNDKGSVADAHKPYKYLVIISGDFALGKQDMAALKWSSDATNAIHTASGEHLRFYPNLYDRLWVHKNNHPPFNTELHLDYDAKHTYGDKTEAVMKAKKKWDPDAVFPARFGKEAEAEDHHGHMTLKIAQEYEQSSEVSRVLAVTGGGQPVVVLGILGVIGSAVVLRRLGSWVHSRQSRTASAEEVSGELLQSSCE
jgi:hypothetical protein